MPKKIFSNRIVMTQARVGKLPTPSSGQIIYYEDKMPGFGVRISQGGSKSFILRRKVDGRAQLITLGRFPGLNVDTARKIATEMIGDIARGQNPQDAKRARRDETTLGKLFKDYMDTHAKLHTRTWQKEQRRFERHLHKWRNRKLSTILRRDIKQLHGRIGKENGHYAANRLIQLLGAVFQHGLNEGLMDGENPARGITKFLEEKRDRFLQPEEVGLFFEALGKEPNETIRDYILVSLLTGARRSNVLSMRWDEVDLGNGVWTIPAGKSKNFEKMSLPLHAFALELLAGRKDQVNSEWVFPGPGREGHLVEPKKGWKRILDRAGIQNLRLHDLRRTLGSWQAARGSSLAIIGKSLGHRSVAATLIYSRLNLDPVRESVNGAVDDLLEAAGQKFQADIVPFPVKARNKSK